MQSNEHETQAFKIPEDLYTKPAIETCSELVSEPALSLNTRTVNGNTSEEVRM